MIPQTTRVDLRTILLFPIAEEMMNPRKLLWAVVTVALFVNACSKSREAADAATKEFRARCDRQAYAEIFLDATPEFQKSTTEFDFVKLMDGVRRQLGGWQSSKSPNWQALSGTGGQTIKLVYQSQFGRGGADEEFVWRIQKDRAVLDGYHVRSPTLALKGSTLP
jgi:hypothetical protein